MKALSAAALNEEALLHRITTRIHQSLELPEILSAAVTEVRLFLNIDRVKIYQFQADGSGVVVAESLDETRLPSLLGLPFPADDIPPDARNRFIQSRSRTIANVASLQVNSSSRCTAQVDVSRPLDPCHTEYLLAMGVQSSIVVPILLHHDPVQQPSEHLGQLWGLLVAHHADPHSATERELYVVELVIDQVAIAIAQADLLTQLRQQADQEAHLNRLFAQLHASHQADLQSVLAETVEILGGTSGRLYLEPDQPERAPELYTVGVQPERLDQGVGRLIEQHRLWQKYLQACTPDGSEQAAIDHSGWSVLGLRSVYPHTSLPDLASGTPQVWAVNNLYREPLFRTLTSAFTLTPIRSLLILPLCVGQQVVGCLTVFRNEPDASQWVGYPSTDPRQLMPHQSFEVWQAIHREQALAWTAAELKLAQAVGERLAMTIEQQRLYQQIQRLNASLEDQVQQRTAQLEQSNAMLKQSTVELQQAIDQQTAIAAIVSKVRASLELDTIFEAATTDLRQRLEVDRVAVFRFQSAQTSLSGQFVSEDVAPDFPSVLLNQQGGLKLGQDVACSIQQDIQAIADLETAEVSVAQRQLLAEWCVRAMLVVPLFKGEAPWGWLCIHHCSGSRRWSPAEIEFVRQIAAQLGVAVQQAEYLEQLKSQASQLEAAAEQQQALAGVIQKIRESLDLNQIFKATTREVRQLLNADRVGVFRFDLNANYVKGRFIAEDTLPEFASIMGITVQDACFSEQYAAGYANGRIQAIADIYDAGLHACHAELLAKLQVRANLILPLLQGDVLWGLLCIHQCASPRQWQTCEIEFTSQIASQLGVALQHADLLTQTRKQAKQLSRTIDDLKQTQMHLVHSEKMSSLGQLVAGVAHEINNPVNFIYGNLSHIETYARSLLNLVQLYQQHYPEPDSAIQQQMQQTDLNFVVEDLPKLLASIKVGTVRIREIVLSLRNFSRLDQAEIKAVNIHEGIDSTLLILQHRLKSGSSGRAIEVIKQYGDLPLVECYAGQLNQVFMNLLSNAIDSLESHFELDTPNGASAEAADQSAGQIVIQTRQCEANQIQISIQDNGKGIAEDIQRKLFDPFFTTKPIGKGTGLGLSISYQIIEKHGGLLHCRSQPGQGAEFVIDIPIKHHSLKGAPVGSSVA